MRRVGDVCTATETYAGMEGGADDGFGGSTEGEERRTGWGGCMGIRAGEGWATEGGSTGVSTSWLGRVLGMEIEGARGRGGRGGGRGRAAVGDSEG